MIVNDDVDRVLKYMTHFCPEIATETNAHALVYAFDEQDPRVDITEMMTSMLEGHSENARKHAAQIVSWWFVERLGVSIFIVLCGIYENKRKAMETVFAYSRAINGKEHVS